VPATVGSRRPKPGRASRSAGIGEIRVVESFEYSGRRGNASAKTTTVAIDGATAASATETYAWSALGAIAELGYPTGLATSEPARSVSHVYDRGFLTSIPGYAESFTYHDNLALASVAHSNGVTDGIGRDPHRMGRPAALWTSGVAGGENWNSGAYAYDGAGNIKSLGGNRFRYDGVSRLREASVWIPQAGGPEGAEELAGESYVFDAFGNLTSRTTVTSAGGSSLATPADPSTNRLTGAVTYDAEGNVRTWNAAQYDFDALGRMTRMRSGAQDWLFAFTAGGERIVQIGGGGLGEKRWTWRDLAGRGAARVARAGVRRPRVDPRLGLPRRGS
jgi:hypothetical protein